MNNGIIIHDGNSGISGVEVGEGVGEGIGVEVGDGLGEGDGDSCGRRWDNIGDINWVHKWVIVLIASVYQIGSAAYAVAICVCAVIIAPVIA